MAFSSIKRKTPVKQIITCTETDCNNTYTWNGYGIKPPRCYACENKLKREKQLQYSMNASNNRMQRNKELLAKSTFNNKTSSGKYSTKKNTSRKRAKTPKELARDNADRWFSRYIRIKYAYKIVGGEVFCQCFIEPQVIKHAKNMDNGHCFSRENKPTRYEEDNCRPQNRSSNRYSGEADHYKFIDKLKVVISEERFNRIDSLRRELGEDNEAFYLQQANKFRKLTNQLVDQLDINKWW